MSDSLDVRGLDLYRIASELGEIHAGFVANTPQSEKELGELGLRASFLVTEAQRQFWHFTTGIHSDVAQSMIHSAAVLAGYAVEIAGAATSLGMARSATPRDLALLIEDVLELIWDVVGRPTAATADDLLFIADLDMVSPELAAEMMQALDALHRALGGGGLEIRTTHIGSAAMAGVAA